MKRAHRLLPAVVLLSALAVAASSDVQPKPEPAVRSGFVVTADGASIHYLEAGPATRPAGQPSLLFVPGWTMTAEIWEKQIARFSRSHRVVAVDPRSQGLSSKTADLNHPAARAADLKRVVQYLELAPVVLVGWSMGVTELASYVDQFGTAGVAGLVLVDGIAGSDFDPNVTPMMFKFAASFGTDRRARTEGFVKGMYRSPDVLADAAYLQRVTDASLQTPTNSALALFLGAFTADYRPALKKIDKPTLIVVAGGENPWRPKYEEMQQLVPGSRLEAIDGAGHALFVDQPERFNTLVAGFLAALPER